MKNLVFALLALCAFASCENGDDIPRKKDRTDIPLTKSEQTLADAGNDFAFSLLREVSSSHAQPSNIILSPISVNYMMSMLNNGAAGETAAEIARTLGFGDSKTEEINAYNQKMIVASADLDPQVTVHTANSIWVRDGLDILPDFRKSNESYYKASVQNMDFSRPDALKQINGWASKNTDGRIPAILDKINPNACIYLLNAISFRGEWSTPFEKSNTGKDVFTDAWGREQEVQMMNATYDGVVCEHEKFRMLSRSYGNGAFSMSILLPDEGVTNAEVIALLNSESWKQLPENRNGYKIHLKLPRFATSYDIELNDVLRSLGVVSAFSSSDADFSKLSTTQIFLSRALQKARIEVDEEGTTAEVVTLGEGWVSSPGPRPEMQRMDFFVNRPFIYLISEFSTGAIYFIGEVNRIE
ncbi:serpin family protein [uncultured Parabacteroides sp.]|uniref:serpin family protein n=2 Tax=uncultured Parabacteroides sp. TaxID=512312 RepID=UPI00263AEF7A|nr:serpin family protein [uncultured Parabacteroides sp.]